MLEYAEYVHMLADEKHRIIAFQVCEKDSAAVPFYKEPKEGKQVLVRITGKKNALRIMNMAGIKDCGKGIRIYGEYEPEDKAIVFDLSKVN